MSRVPDEAAIARLDAVPRVRLARVPTPIQRLSRLERAVGAEELWIQRDDLTGLAGGGNKTRKLEYLVAEAEASGADVLLTAGAAQSNHCRQTAAAAAARGLRCVLALGGEHSEPPRGNLLLDRLLGAEIIDCEGDRRGERLPQICEALRAGGATPYVVPYGGSSSTGALGYVRAVGEWTPASGPAVSAFDRIVFASSSGGTHAGLLVGARLFGLDTQIVGVRIDREDSPGELARSIARLATETAARLGLAAHFDPDEVHLVEPPGTAGYGVVTRAEREAVERTARTEGILLDPVYTGRAMAALLAGHEVLRRGRVLFLHTGGTPALHAYASALTAP